MRKLTAIGDVVVLGQLYQDGQLIEISDNDTASYLVRNGYASEGTNKPVPKAKKTAKRKKAVRVQQHHRIQ